MNNFLNNLLKIKATTVDLTGTITPTKDGQFDQIIGALITMAQVICYGAAVIIMMIIGIKFITAAPDGKAQIKEKLVPTTIGALVLFSVGSIIKIVGSFAINNIS